MKTIIRWIRETITAELELLEMHWKHIRCHKSYGDISHEIARRWMKKRKLYNL